MGVSLGAAVGVLGLGVGGGVAIGVIGLGVCVGGGVDIVGGSVGVGVLVDDLATPSPVISPRTRLCQPNDVLTSTKKVTFRLPGKDGEKTMKMVFPLRAAKVPDNCLK